MAAEATRSRMLSLPLEMQVQVLSYLVGDPSLYLLSQYISRTEEGNRDKALSRVAFTCKTLRTAVDAIRYPLPVVRSVSAALQALAEENPYYDWPSHSPRLHPNSDTRERQFVIRMPSGVARIDASSRAGKLVTRILQHYNRWHQIPIDTQTGVVDTLTLTFHRPNKQAFEALDRVRPHQHYQRIVARLETAEAAAKPTE